MWAVVVIPVVVMTEVVHVRYVGIIHELGNTDVVLFAEVVEDSVKELCCSDIVGLEILGSDRVEELDDCDIVIEHEM